ncbi:hypothetical protein BPAE_0424g00010 [Botrytis paeoniae]|uniref:Aminoglycoside phosphotransferase domain-containing protein n=1 Tax=Botrytis paeoniae TaxID=278948 RepID=A0A4Z1F8D9_9HELO|nr:hypothetical protein BPAE_0424g00010 [Botrytis paeoniae]
MSRAKGKPLGELREIICNEHPHMRRVDGGELLDNHIGNCYGFPCVKTGRNEEEWLENLTPAVRKALLWKLWRRNKAGLKNPTRRDAWVKMADAHIVKIKADFPKGGPYVLTHGDLHDLNLYGSNDNADQKGKITATIDWETAGYFPWWVELVRNSRLLRGHGTLEERVSGFGLPTFNKED